MSSSKMQKFCPTLPAAQNNNPQGNGGMAQDIVSFKDDIVSHLLVHNTYTRLKDLYEEELRDAWVEKIEPVKHIQEDLAVAAFLIELWRTMYGAVPEAKTTEQNTISRFPGFVDIACGNGVVVYVLLMEGYSGCGYDARRRQTWGIFPSSVQERLLEKAYIPKPFADTGYIANVRTDIHTGDFPPGTFIISNHADELTLWTPLMASLACPVSPLPFLAIPCCSHSLSGSSYRFPAPNKSSGKSENKPTKADDDVIDQNPQPASGDLRALRAAKAKEKTAEGILDSMYGSLAAKTMQIAQEVGYDVESTQLQLLSTRNIGIVGGRQLVARERRGESRDESPAPASVDPQSDCSSKLARQIQDIVERECTRDGGIHVAARTWIERALSLHRATRMVNLHPVCE
ncbi:tRNA (uracil-O(2)-)-methyltransferase [Penicillium verhagenii]|uniref:tRNA (uracil-O(2)-)-methyltransferase n=1 Tax=Penicillium verhagenii TaxID=1562060 RepID=UPI002545935B|nr:tRNA (uracil-O(2)-)-methyltransferase [Penicillium verhagenii]KAJ5919231.1 tRNA (uracil-O(2)-)-methyltransferase [Penicillium verhagenii]